MTIALLEFPRRSVDGKHLMRFLRGVSVFKFLRRGVNKTLLVSTNEPQIQD